MKRLKFGKKTGLTVMVVALTFIMCLSATFATLLSNGLFDASAESHRVTMSELMDRYPIIEYVVGPVDVVDVNNDGVIDRQDLSREGKYTYIQDDAHKDVNGNYTNNVYGIPANKYFDVESYIYTTGVKDSEAGRTLYGWKSDIQACASVYINPDKTNDPLNNSEHRLAENGELLDANGLKYSTAASIGIFVTYQTTTESNDKEATTIKDPEGIKTFSTTEKYALIVPKDITIVGEGSAAFATSSRTYYADSTYPNDRSESYGTSASEYSNYTDFACFITDRQAVKNTDGTYSYSPEIKATASPYFWQPRERLAGVYFPEDSRLTTIKGGSEAWDSGSSRTTASLKGKKAAFQRCDNLRFFIMPQGVKTIGAYAFKGCSQLLDLNIPSSVKSLGQQAFGGCSALKHISLDIANDADFADDAFSGCNFRHVVKTGKEYNGVGNANSTIFVMGNKSKDGVPDSGAFLFERTSSGALSALSLAGETGEAQDKVFVFPSAADFKGVAAGEKRERRDGVVYDYLDSAGKTIKVDVDFTVSTYSLAKQFAQDTWCQNVILPKEVTSIGDYAFNGAHVKYLETYAKTIGTDAFTEGAGSPVKEQWIYLHGDYGTTESKIVTSAFKAVPQGRTRHIVYENSALYSKFLNNGAAAAPSWAPITLQEGETDPSKYIHYQIPVYANVNSDDGEQFSIAPSDMSNVFFNDSDYGDYTKEIVTGDNEILVTKRLNDKTFNWVKQSNGTWKLNDEAYYPVLSNMTETVWYSDAACTDTKKIAAADGIGSLYGSTLTEVNFYTRKVKYPVFDKQKWAFDETKTAEEYSFLKLLGLSNDYAVTCAGLTNPWNEPVSNANLPEYAKNAGTYTLKVDLNADKWGVWKDPASDKVVTTATVAQKEIDLSKLANIPTFYAYNTSTNSTVKLLGGELTPIYEHLDGWSTVEAGNLGKAEVINSYIGYAGTILALQARKADGAEWTMYNVVPDTATTLSAKESERYSASYTFTVKSADYKFVYLDMTASTTDFNQRRMGFVASSMLERSAVFNKQWYITKSSNWLVNKGSDITDKLKNQYKPVVDSASGNEIKSWKYEFDGYTVNSPELAYGGEIKGVTADIYRNGVKIVEGIRLTVAEGESAVKLDYYINPAMPAGNYELVIHAPEFTDGSQQYDAFNVSHEFQVLEKDFDETATNDIVKALTGGKTETGNTFEQAYNGTLFLHSDMSSLVDSLNALVNIKQKDTAKAGYWATPAASDYFVDAVLMYNRDELQGGTYYTFDGLDNLANVPKNVGTYLVYYSIYAPNYNTIGGEKNESTRRNYRFTTVIYRELSADDVLTEISKTAYVYNGGDVYANVSDTEYYEVSYDQDADYVNAGTKTVILTIRDAVLNRWKATTSSDINVNGKIAEINYAVAKANNSWTLTPTVPGWQYGGFNAKVYTIVGNLAYSGVGEGANVHTHDVYYRLGKLANNTIEWIDVGGTLAVDGIAENDRKYYFAVNENGEIVDDASQTIKAKFDSLNVNATYVLGSFVVGCNNVNPLTTEQNSVVRLLIASNSWNKMPALTSWQYTGFTEDSNFKEGTARFKGEQPFSYKVVQVVGSTETTVAEFNTLADTVDGTMTAAAKLKALSVGGYKLYVTLPKDANGNYDQLTYETAFAVTSAANAWTTTPGLTGWRYQAFTAVNFIAGVPQLGSASDVKYVLTKDGSESFKINGSSVSSYTLVLNADKSLHDDTIAALNTLAVGDYTLTATLDGELAPDSTTEYNYKTMSLPITFRVSKVANSWTTSPALTGWKYTEFASSSFIVGIPKYSTPDKVVYKLGDLTLTVAKDAEGNWTLSEASVNALKDLPVGSYTLTANLIEGDDYDNLTYTAPVSVTQADNSWKRTPGMTSWQYKGFNADGNFTAGVPNVTIQVDGKDAVITYTVSGNGTSISFTNISTAESALKALSVNAADSPYKLTVSYSGNANYKQLNYETYFNVIKATNTWATDPNLTSWVYKQFNSANFRAGVPTFNEDASKTVTYVLKASDGNAFKINGAELTSYNLELNADGTLAEATITALNSLEVLNTRGGYVVTVSLTGTDNYGDLPDTLSFNVLASTNNAWQTNGIPEISGWTYGGFTDSLIKEGVAEFGDVRYTVQTVSNDNVGAAVENYENLTFAALVAKLNGIGAGSYNLYVKTVESNNYNHAQHNVRFTVAKAESNWTKYPSIEGWTYGQLARGYLTGQTDHANNNEISYKFYPAVLNASGIYVADTTQNPVVIEINTTTVPAGWYALVATAPATDNYQGTTHTVVFQVLKADNSWKNEHQPESTFTWVWGHSSEIVTEDTGFVKAQAIYCDKSQKVTYVIKHPDGTYSKPIVKTKDVDATELLSELAKLGVGEYEITVSVAGNDDFGDISRITYVTVTPASFKWASSPADATWTWDERNKELYKQFKEPSIAAVADTGVTIAYTLVGERRGNVILGENAIATFADLQNALKDIDADTYTVTVTVSCLNYEPLVGKAIITVNQAANVLSNAFGESISKEFDKDYTISAAPSATYGVVKFYDANGVEITDIESWINSHKTANEANVSFTTKVEGTVNYPEISRTTQLTVTGRISTWDNPNGWNSNVSQKYSTDMSEFWDALKLPVYTLTRDDKKNFTNPSKLEYVIEFVSADGKFSNGKTFTTADDVRAYLKDSANFTKDGTEYRVGTYTITAAYTPGDANNYTILKETVTVNVSADNAAWTTQPKTEYRGAYQAIVIDEPSANYPVTVTVTGSEGECVWDKSKYDSLQAFLRSLDQGEYTVVSQVLPTNNYNGLSAVTTRVIINPALNTWKDESVLEPLYTFTRLDETLYTTTNQLESEQAKYAITIPAADRGDVVCSIDGKDDYVVIKDGKLTELYKLPAGDHALRFDVAADAKGNYNGLRYDCTIRVSKTANTWETAPNPSYSWTGKVNVGEFITPVAKYHNELLRYEITKVGDSDYTSVAGLNQDDFEKELAKLVNGTYIVTMHIGGDVAKVYSKDDGATKGKAVEYNSNYDAFTATTEITVTRHTNSWTTPLSSSSWTYGDKLGASAGEGIVKVLTMPQAAHGNEAIVFTVYDANDKPLFEAKASKYTDDAAENAFAEIINWFGNADRNAGVYTVTATIEASDVYEAPQATTALYTIGKVIPKWDETDTKLEDYLNVNWIWGDENNKSLPVLKLANWNNNAIKYKVNDVTLNDIGSTSENEGHWMYYLKRQDAGTYRIVATVDADVNNEALTFEGTVTISVAPNSWLVRTANGSNLEDGNKTFEWEYGKAIPITYKPAFNNVGNYITVRINNVVVPIKLNDDLAIDGAKTFQEYFNNCSVGTYTVTISIAADKQHGALDDSFTVTITKSKENGWEEAGGQFTVGGIVDTNTGALGWTWGDSITDNIVKVATPKKGTSVRITVYKIVDGSEVEQFVTTLTYDRQEISAYSAAAGATVNENDLNALKAKLAALDAGDYTVSVQIPETNDYASYTQTKNEFTIKTAENYWINDESRPHIEGWSFDGGTAYPDSTPKYGNKNDVIYDYAPAKYDDKGEVVAMTAEMSKTTDWDTALPFNAGSYYIRGRLPASDAGNYTELEGYGSFSIGKGTNTWVDMPGVIAWNWNGYDENANLFSGSVRSGGTVTFVIEVVSRPSGSRALDSSDFFAPNGTANLYRSYANLLSNGFGFELDENRKPTKIISSSVWDALNALKPNTYKLIANAAATENYGEENGSSNFTVGKATDTWTAAPNVVSFNYNGFDSDGDFTAGVAKYGTVYGTVSYRVVNGDNNVVTWDKDNGLQFAQDDSTVSLTEAELMVLLSKLDAGNYLLKAWSEADIDATYESLYSSDEPYNVLFKVFAIENGWTEKGTPKPSIEEYYTALHLDDFNFTKWFGTPETIGDGNIVCTILNVDYSETSAGSFTYTDKDLFDKIKSLPSGDYVVRLTVSATTNYLGLSADVGVFIKRYANDFDEFPEGNLTAQWKSDDGVTNATELDKFTITANKGKGTEVYTINGNECADFDALKAYVKTLNAGSYQVAVSVAQTDDYEGISRTIQLDVAQGANELSWSVDESWTWNDGGTHFTSDKPKYGKTVRVEIIKEGSAEAISSITLDFTESNPTRVVNQVLNGLDAGEYTLSVTAKATDNYVEVTNSNVVTVIKATNAWKQNGAPALSNGALNNDTQVYQYAYGKKVIASATPKHGEAKYTYYKQGNQTALADVPTEVGAYTVVFTVDETDNYFGIEAAASGTIAFEIVRITNDGFIVSPGAIGWIWGDYDRKVHMFTGIPRSGGDVSYSILDGAKTVVKVGEVALDNIPLVDDKGVHHNDVDKDLYVSQRFAELIAQLKEGSYSLRINVAETDNYNSFSAETPFRVTAATNRWIETPKISSWSLGLWTEEDNTPKAESRFGHPEIVLTSQNNNEVFYRSVYNAQTGKYDVTNNLENALAGWYTMRVTVNALEGCYGGLDETVYVQVYMRGVADEKNYWYDLPGISSWEAKVGGIGAEPYGTPLRGLPYFEFYHSKRDKDNNLVIDWDNPVKSGADSYLVQKGVNKYFQAFYMPMAPGDYFMVACAKNVDSEGNVIEADNLRETDNPYQFRIEYRTNSFVDDPHIATLLFLGERSNWVLPTAQTVLTGKDNIVFTYKNLDTNEDFGTALPDKEGRYELTATATATYSREISKTATFTIELSTNEWIEQPTIEDWSEEFEDKNPIAEALYGTENIVYTYENLDTGEIKNVKPTEEGNYKMTATVTIKGYKDLVGTATFTIEPAYNRDLVVIDIVLGCVACALAIFVIIFAIRRYKEN